jgi:cell division protease FtsH
MGGRAGEELLLDGDYTQGAVGDLSAATALATEMVSSWGMGERLANVMEQQLFMGGMGESVHLESDRLIVTALSEAREVLSSNLPYFKAVAEKLLDAESLDLKELKAIAEDMGLTLPKKLSEI